MAKNNQNMVVYRNKTVRCCISLLRGEEQKMKPVSNTGDFAEIYETDFKNNRKESWT